MICESCGCEFSADELRWCPEEDSWFCKECYEHLMTDYYDDDDDWDIDEEEDYE